MHVVIMGCGRLGSTLAHKLEARGHTVAVIDQNADAFRRLDREGALIMVDDERLPLRAGEKPQVRKVRFRTLGCYPLTGAMASEAETLEAIIAEMLVATTSERQGRVIDHDPTASMEKKKQEGYF